MAGTLGATGLRLPVFHRRDGRIAGRRQGSLTVLRGAAPVARHHGVRSGMRVSLLAGTTLALLATGPAAAAWDDWSLSPWTGTLGDFSYSVGGQVHGTVFDADEPGHFDLPNATGAAQVNASIQR